MHATFIKIPLLFSPPFSKQELMLLSMISQMIRAKAYVPHTIIRAKVADPLIEIEALTGSVSFMHSVWNMHRGRYTKLAFESSR